MQETEVLPDLYGQIVNNLNSVKLPSSLWALHLHPSRSFFAFVLISDCCFDGVKIEKCLVFSKTEHLSVKVDVYVNNMLVNNFLHGINEVVDVDYLSWLILRVDGVKLCNKFSESNKNCLGLVEKSAITCTTCVVRSRARKTTASRNDLIDENQPKRIRLEDISNTSNKDTEDDLLVERRNVLSTANSPSNVCSDCKKTFPSKKELKKHSRKHSLGRELYKCEVCNKTFAHRRTRIVHMIKQHENLTTLFICNNCGKGYRTFELLREHREKRLCGKSYACGLCGKNFDKEIHQLAHFKNHTGKSSETHVTKSVPKRESRSVSYNCSICQKPYDDYGRMRAHRRKHSTCSSRDFICENCNKKFTTQGNLQAHKRLSEEMQALRVAFWDKTDINS